MGFTIDTNILVHSFYDTKEWEAVKKEHFEENTPELLISIVSEGEIWSIADQREFGDVKKQRLQMMLSEFIRVPVRFQDLVDRYAEIDVFSQGKHPHYKLGTTSRNMGKNDLWIAATASVTDTPLVTTDGDFDHLVDSPFLEVIKINHQYT